MDKSAQSFVRTTLETMLFSQILAPALKDAGPVGELEAQAFAGALAGHLEHGRDDER